MTIFGVLSYGNSAKSLEAQYKNEANSVLEQTKLAFEYEFSNAENLLNKLSFSPVLKNVENEPDEKINALLRSSQEVALTNGELYYGVENGEFYHGNYGAMPEGYNPVEQDWYEMSNNSLNKVVWTEPYLDYMTQDIIISAIKAVKGADNIHGVLVIHFSLTELSDQISHSKIGEEGLVMLLSSTGTVLANHDNHMLGESLFGNAYTKTIKQATADFISKSIKDKKYWIHANNIEQNKMSILTAISQNEINRTVFKNHLPVFLLGIIAMLLSSAISYLVILKGVKPLHRLISLMGVVEKGNYDVHADIQQYTEINRLAEGFNSMIEAIQKRDAALLISNKELMMAEERLRARYEELKVSEKKILHLASYDSLTGLLNRRSLLELLPKALDDSKDGQLKAVIFMDLDNFKTVNDTLGHSFGDKLIIEVANKLMQLNLPHSDIARISGDEFIIVVHELEDVAQVEKIASQIVQLFDAPIHIGTRHLNITGSIGIAMYPNHASTAEELLKIADMAMYRAKETGKNGYQIFDEKIKLEVEEKLKIEDGIRESLQSNQLELVFQPLFNPQENRIASVEALLRFISPSLANYNIMQIIQWAELSGQIVEIDQWVLREACRTIKLINQNIAQPIRVSVNISAIHIMQHDFTENVMRIIQEADVPVEWIKLEITETSLMESFSLNIPKLHELQKMGVEFHLDDFGTGYSSLNYLKTLPIECVKIDKSFVDVLLQSEKDGKIVETIIQLAHNIGLKVVAEGVEEEAQFEVLRSYQCDLIQGYYISKPLKKAQLIERLNDILVN